MGSTIFFLNPVMTFVAIDFFHLAIIFLESFIFFLSSLYCVFSLLLQQAGSKGKAMCSRTAAYQQSSDSISQKGNFVVEAIKILEEFVSPD